MNSQHDSRILWLDVLRGIGISLVWLGHSGNQLVLSHAKDWIFSFHMPLFFLLSGLFFKSGKYSFAAFVRRRAAMLLWPYLVFSILVAVLDLAVCRPHSLSETFFSILRGRGPQEGIALWFLTMLFYTEVAFFFLERLCRKSRLLLGGILVLFAGLGIFFSTRAIILPLRWDALPLALVFYGSGYLAAPLIPKVASLSPWRLLGLSVLCGATGLLLVKGLNVTMDIRLNLLFGPLGMAFVTAYLGSAFCFFGAASLPGLPFMKMPAKILAWFGCSTIVILALHQEIGVFFFQQHLIPHGTGKLLQIFLLAGLAWTIDRYAPFLIRFPDIRRTREKAAPPRG